MWRIINPYKMACAVREHQVLYKEYSAYVLIFFALKGIIIPPRHLIQSENILIMYAVQTLMVLGVFLPFAVAYIANGATKGAHFWYRFIGIHTPISIIMLAALFISVPFINPLLFYLSGFTPTSGNFPHLSWGHLVFYTFYLTIFNILVYKAIRIASSA